jgi:hypothetical protein
MDGDVGEPAGRKQMFESDCSSNRRNDPQPALPAPRSTSGRKLFLPGIGLLLALLIAACFGAALRPGGVVAQAESDGAGSVSLIPGQSGDPQQAAQAAAETDAPPQVRELITRLDSARNFLQSTRGYAAKFTQQVHKDGRLLDPEEFEIKVQHEPFAVFMEWEKDGQQALFVEGENDNKLLVHPTRGFGRLRKVWILEPDSGLAMRGSRRPVTEIGLLNLVDLLLGFHREHLLCSKCVTQPADVGDSGSTQYTLTFNGPHENPYYARTDLWLCNERHVPLRIENYFWTDDNRVGSLLESYHYTDICVDECVAEADFDRNNEDYKF